ncbi:MBL fold metallo-hydrolase [Lysobacter sp. TY2-98]|uniref:MBL fold metallo-hydrolase RNA specificity domain-containing protein n=1 Tax=Lysobacter sp. TY2-98 TaxID=2290922 RepID=UPI000E20873E|nr:MBL fold metallo-hydrolase [Lysobacter sp. TY2-98]AXK71046.1 MBL fold metallo-hydrolase [Lysobacter sp. TY2-98]
MSTPSVPTLRFLGAAGTVTGSRFLVDVGAHRLLVDCGLFQGYKVLRERNRRPFPVPPSSIDLVLLTHAHLDHSGYLPRIIQEGYQGKVLCTEATRDLCALLLPDSGRLLEEEARFAAKKGYSKHAQPLPLYTEADARRSLRHLSPVSFDKDIEIPGGTARFIRAGHILGAAQITLTLDHRRVHFSGDLGRPVDALLPPPAPHPACDTLVCESTYGDRVHPFVDAEDELAEVINRVTGRGGVVVIPAFAVGRAQELLLHIARLRQRDAIHPVPVYLNSPMAEQASGLYRRHPADHKLDAEACRQTFDRVTFVGSAEASKALNRQHGPMIILSASGMLTGGRVLHHVTAFAPDARNAIVLSGYQAAGTRGARLVAGDSVLRIFGRDVPINAEVVQLKSFSAHADSNEITQWLRDGPRPSAAIYLTHGEPSASDALRLRVQRDLGWPIHVADHGEEIPL